MIKKEKNIENYCKSIVKVLCFFKLHINIALKKIST